MFNDCIQKFLACSALCMIVAAQASGQTTTDNLERIGRTIDRAPYPDEVQEYFLRSSDIAEDHRAAVKLGPDGTSRKALFAKDSVVLRLAPDLDETAIRELLEKYSLDVVEIYPEIQTIHVRADLKPFFWYELGDETVNDQYFRGLSDARIAFEEDPRILVAAPDLIVTEQQAATTTGPASNLVTPEVFVVASASERVDWGIANTESDQLWGLKGAHDGVMLGVLDTGFARHEDLTFSQPAINFKSSDHGNHVSGIACARHNGIGVRGVLPNCFVVPRAREYYTYPNSVSSIAHFNRNFSQIMGEMLKEISSDQGVDVYNVSLAYNWMSNFGINPDDPNQREARSLIESQGEILVAVLGIAAQKDKVIYSAAGNDSPGLATPIDAIYSSPFNWAAKTSFKRTRVRSGVVVEAHDKNGNKAAFSNKNGDLSCPGVDIQSVLAFDAQKNPSNNSYGIMSGTSMASPYCAAGHLLFKLVRPDYSDLETVECLLHSDQNSSSGTVMLKLTKALEACPPRTN